MPVLQTVSRFRIFVELAFEIADDVPNKWEIIASKLQRQATVPQLLDRYQALLRDLWLIERGDLTRASFNPPGAGGPVSGGHGPAGGSGGAEPAGGSGGAEPSGSAEMKKKK